MGRILLRLAIVFILPTQGHLDSDPIAAQAYNARIAHHPDKQ
jgi:hypothetical protein